MDGLMTSNTIRIYIALAVALILASTLAHGQRPFTAEPQRSTATHAAVQFLYPEQITLPAGKPTTVTLHFRIAPGLHINSHTPKEEELIPTTFSIPEGFGVQLIAAVYPPGEEFILPLDPKNKLNVYSGEFNLQARIVATAGDHLVEAKLRYQACDNSACMPPKSIPVAIYVIGK